MTSTRQKLADILDELLDYYGGFEGLSRKIEIRCFCIDPSVKSSLRFYVLNRTGFVGDFYLS
ncbi:DUF2132 domain-containing protein (plasmid) [Acinetobacter piscicola]|uniref:DUF2132 domain-containing protein n=1 Tax=Acinetobacter piscicola TaxID=2006115 RepID=A0A7S6W060_9GAMM|nr:DUF2132 domain-containing protein [Acinetobacter piscicola]